MQHQNTILSFNMTQERHQMLVLLLSQGSLRIYVTTRETEIIFIRSEVMKCSRNVGIALKF